MAWLDYIPWWVWPLIVGGGGGVILALVPGALALVVGIWNALPGWMRWLLGGFIVALLAFLRGRNQGRRAADEEAARKDRQAVDKAHEVTKRNEQRTDDEIDKHLRDTGGLWPDDPPPRRNPPRRGNG